MISLAGQRAANDQTADDKLPRHDGSSGPGAVAVTLRVASVKIFNSSARIGSSCPLAIGRQHLLTTGFQGQVEAETG
jgi:hypothetical protein